MTARPTIRWRWILALAGAAFLGGLVMAGGSCATAVSGEKALEAVAGKCVATLEIQARVDAVNALMVCAMAAPDGVGNCGKAAGEFLAEKYGADMALCALSVAHDDLAKAAASASAPRPAPAAPAARAAPPAPADAGGTMDGASVTIYVPLPPTEI